MGKNFIERQSFLDLMDELRRADGTEYQDPGTAYGDMSRLVVAWLAASRPEDLEALYNRLGWKGGPRTMRQIHQAANLWLAQHHSGRQFGGQAGAAPFSCPEDWARAIREWAESHRPQETSADWSRESIYAGRGE